MVGKGVVVHVESAATRLMRQDQAARRGKDIADLFYFFGLNGGDVFHQSPMEG
ncbi:MAG: hypothetical protein L6425_04275 [Candidatus Aminicenantes bacterium]|nr:hypothetical protein [Candidatus Aminicenantes bacterium]